MTSLLKSGIKTILAGISAIMILSGFTIVYCNSGIHITNTTGATDYKWEARQLKTIMTEGFAWFHMDDAGFNNSYPAKTKVSNLLIGSSHMGAINVNPKKNTGYLLNEMMPGYTYNIGMGGHKIYNCVRNLSDAIDEYMPTGYVFLETNSIELDVDSMKKVLDGTYPRIPSYDTGMIYKIQKFVPAIKHLYNNIDVWRSGTGISPEVERVFDEEYEELLGQFLAKAQRDASKTGAKLVIFYQPRTRIDEAGNIINSTDQDPLQVFKAKCKENDILFVDLTDPFTELYETENILAHGFYNTAVGAGHLNEAGHRAIAETLVRAIQEEGE